MELSDCMIPLFAQVLAFAQQSSGDLKLLSASLDDAIMIARERAHSAGHLQPEVDEALFAVVAWADEKLIATPWIGPVRWQSWLLQRRYYGLSNAGVVFYERLTQLAPEQLQVREVFYVCLVLGFAGQYAYDRNSKALAEIKDSNLALLVSKAGATPEALNVLFPDGYAVAAERVGEGRLLARAWLRNAHARVNLVAIFAPLGFLLMLYCAFHLIVGHSVDSLLAQIHT